MCPNIQPKSQNILKPKYESSKVIIQQYTPQRHPEITIRTEYHRNKTIVTLVRIEDQRHADPTTPSTLKVIQRLKMNWDANLRIEHYGYDVRPYESHALELHHSRKSGGLQSSGFQRINEKGRKTRFGPKLAPYPPRKPPSRQLERLSYDRPSETSQASQTGRYSQPPNDMGNTPTVDATRSEARSVTPSFQPRLFEPRRSFDRDGYSGPRHETRDNTEPPSPSLDSVAAELCELLVHFQDPIAKIVLAADWEDEYEQDDPVTSEGNVFKDSAAHKAGGSLRTPPAAPALRTFGEQNRYPIQNKCANFYAQMIQPSTLGSESTV